MSTFVPLPNLHNSFSESCSKTTQILCSNKQHNSFLVNFPLEKWRYHITMNSLCGSVLYLACSSLMYQTDRCCLFTMRKTLRCHIFQKCHNRLHFNTWFFWHLRRRWIIKEFLLGMSVPGSGFFLLLLMMKTNSSFQSVPKKKKNRMFWHSPYNQIPVLHHCSRHIPMSKCVTSQCTTQPWSPIVSAVFFYKYRGFIYSDWSGKWGPVLWKESLRKTVKRSGVRAEALEDRATQMTVLPE